ncbi:hypothetical protein EV424DRAFT_1535017 [Suillus variegatus]|nr:hypothetical protein EV424DRAFT_1535017 [Suillus variegatus]
MQFIRIQLEVPNIPTTVVILRFNTEFVPWIVNMICQGSTFALLTAPMSEPSAPARHPDSTLKNAEEMEWINDPDDDTAVLPPPPASNSNGTLNSFICRSGCAIKPTEKICEGRPSRLFNC